MDMSITFDEFAFDESQYEEKDYSNLPAGDYRVRIDGLEPKISKNGNKMIELTLAVSGHNHKLWRYLVFTNDNKRNNQMLGDFGRSFGIARPNPSEWMMWIGQVGAARVKIEKQDDGSERSVIAYFLTPEQAKKLPEWVEPQNGLLAGAATPVTDVPW